MAKGPDRPPNGDPGPPPPGYPPRAAPRLHATGNSVLLAGRPGAAPRLCGRRLLRCRTTLPGTWGFTPTLPLVQHHDPGGDSQRPQRLNCCWVEGGGLAPRGLRPPPDHLWREDLVVKNSEQPAAVAGAPENVCEPLTVPARAVVEGADGPFAAAVAAVAVAGVVAAVAVAVIVVVAAVLPIAATQCEDV